MAEITESSLICEGRRSWRSSIVGERRRREERERLIAFMGLLAFNFGRTIAENVGAGTRAQKWNAG
jgi:hypothetical protein